MFSGFGEKILGLLYLLIVFDLKFMWVLIFNLFNGIFVFRNEFKKLYSRRYSLGKWGFIII